MRVERHPEADQELEEAAIWYERQQSGLGEDFLQEFEWTLRRICEDPLRWRIFHNSNRKLNFDRFPYAIVYSIQEDAIWLKAVMHLHRRPFYWRARA
jgi:hypothetical protein